jgi:hypothetical protein
LGFPSIPDYKWIVKANFLKDCPVVSQDVDVSLKVWGKQVPMLKGSTVRCKAPVVREDVVEVLKEIRLIHKRVTLTIDIFLSMAPHTLQLSVCEFVSCL